MQEMKNSGFTLMEVITAVSIVSIGMLGMASLTYIASAYSYSLQEEFQAVSQAYRLEYEMRRVISLAVRVSNDQTVSNPRNGYIADSFNCLSAFNSSSRNSNCSTSWKEVGAFFREDSAGTSRDIDGNVLTLRGIMPTAIWYRRAQHNQASPLASVSGNVIIKLGQYEQNGGVWGPERDNTNWAPEATDMYFDQLSSFGIDRIDDSRGVSRVDVMASFRYHGVSRIKTWCSYRDIVDDGLCQFNPNPIPNYYDNEYRFTINMVNNMLDVAKDSGQLERRVEGTIHFFKMIGNIGN